MSWQLYVQSAEAVLEANKIPSSQEIISLIKRINPPLCSCPRPSGNFCSNHTNTCQSALKIDPVRRETGKE